MTIENDRQHKTNNEVVTPAALDEVESLLADLEITEADLTISAAHEAQLSKADVEESINPGGLTFAQLAGAWREKQSLAVAKQSAKEARERYAAQKQADGAGEVRGYFARDIAPQQRHEGPDDYRRRYHRDLMRIYRGAEQAEPNPAKPTKVERERARRAAMTPEQKKIEAERKKRKRADAKARVKGDQ